jgi:hypothetical protein
MVLKKVVANFVLLKERVTKQTRFRKNNPGKDNS